MNTHPDNAESVHKALPNIPCSPADCSAWVEQYGDMLYRIALSRVNDEDHAQDLVQETFLSALRGYAMFQGQASVGTWLVSILKHKIIDSYKHSYREVTLSSLGANTDESIFFRDHQDLYEGHWKRSHLPKSLPQFHTQSVLPDSTLEHQELMTLLHRCMQALPKGMRQIFVMRTVDDIDTEEICKDLGVSESNVWTTLHRARTRVRQCIEKYYT